MKETIIIGLIILVAVVVAVSIGTQKAQPINKQSVSLITEYSYMEDTIRIYRYDGFGGLYQFAVIKRGNSGVVAFQFR